MYYIYTLGIDDIVFYVGITQRPVERYNDHYCDSWSRAYPISRYLLACRNKVINMTLVDYSDNVYIGEDLEKRYISYYKKLFYLINDEFNFFPNRKLPHILKLPKNNLVREQKANIRKQKNIIDNLWKQKKLIHRCGLLSNRWRTSDKLQFNAFIIGLLEIK